MKKLVTIVVGAVLSLAPGVALGQQWSGTYQPAMPARTPSSIDNIGEAQQLVFGVDRVMGISFDRATVERGSGASSVESTYKSTNIFLLGTTSMQGIFVPSTNIPRLALDYFPTDGFSIGGSVFFMSSSMSRDLDPDPGNSSGDVGTFTTWGIHPRVGYAYPFDETFSIWPRAGITYFKITLEDEDGNEDSIGGLDLTGELMLGISPMSHFAILLGPFADIGLSGTDESNPKGGPSSEDDATFTSFGLAVSIVGYY